MKRLLIAAALLLSGTAAASERLPKGMVAERLVMLYRHGVRAPLAPEAALDGLEHQPLPDWPVGESMMTPHGLDALTQQGREHARLWQHWGLLPAKACPAAKDVAIWTNTSPRTIASGKALVQGIVEDCSLPVGHLDEAQVDPLFEPLRAGAVEFDGAKALASVWAYTGGAQAQARRYAKTLRLMQRVIGCKICDLSQEPASLGLSSDGRELVLTGPIRRYSGTAQVFLLQYLQGMPMRDVAWGRADLSRLRQLGALHAALFDVYARPPYLAARVAGPLARDMAQSLTAPAGPRVKLYMGHDTNIAALGALLGLKPAFAGYAAGDPPPGGGVGLLLLRDRQGRRWLRAFTSSMSPVSLRQGAAGHHGMALRDLRWRHCAGAKGSLCPLPSFLALVQLRAVPVMTVQGQAR
ncbi:histidine-type phosphatase [Novosphingobium umbonatum]|uniref:Histidine-type phosphatase n=1 Tax=Novosphingobium umbonatum TaxID=1908524 RepID=A0A437N7F5_9SPHN|nr:histidine-type phosphatase [Novosphingobium umbonatum]RVU05869.1 histidine-type phosphatase [Novosphingobium umbonatum]